MPRFTKYQLNNLYRRAKQGATTMDLGINPAEEGLSNAELDHLAAELQASDDFHYRARIIRILHYAAVEHTDTFRHILSPFFNHPQHARTILMILCRDWGLAPYYKPEMIAFIRGISWDNDDLLLSEYCQFDTLDFVFENWDFQDDPQLLREIISLYENPATPHFTRDHALDVIDKILHRPANLAEDQIIQTARDLADQLEAQPDFQLIP